MKKTLLAVAIPALFATSAQAVELYKTDAGSVDFYGQLRTELKKSEDADATLGAGSSRAGVSAKYDVNEDLYVHGKYEFGTPGGEYGESLTGRLHIAGFGGSWGKVSLGQQWTLQDDFYGADWSYFYGGSVIRYTPISGGVHSNLIKYNYDADAFSIAASYGLDENDSAPELFELFATATAGNFDFIAGVASESGFTSVDNPDYDEDDDNSVESFTLGLDTMAYTASVGYTMDKVYLQGTYYYSDIDLGGLDISENAFGVAATYAWADNATAYAGYEYVTYDVETLDEFDSTIIYVGTDYHLNDWSRLYVEYGYADGETLGYTNKDSENSVGIETADGESFYAVGYRVYW
ncbi:porin [Vibrio hippocampi]|uniref:Porin domain-containing protein n=1 Tax=Vibrio hippocampi TaxID=654686 RepID=A0ABM8ZHZ3_9VIBR|nr:porin [Vibrio hippocampi]CAH0526443.1 hypothetical protein VHP8226_01808 [Vibrio hippocampi]